MEINENVIEVLKELKINKEDGLSYLVMLYFDLDPSYIPDILKQKINLTGIVENTKTGLVWNIKLFEDQVTAFDWVKTEYVTLFKQKNPKKGGHVREATKLMKNLFAHNPEIRKEDVLAATKMYMRSVDQILYLKLPHYFLSKGVGVQKEQMILDWLEKYKDYRERNKETLQTTMDNKLQ